MWQNVLVKTQNMDFQKESEETSYEATMEGENAVTRM
jgi:hypothetical protein